MEAKARYANWVNEKSAFSFRKAVLRRDRADFRKAFDEASESSERSSSYHLSAWSDGSLREHIDTLNIARSSFKDHLFRDSDVRYMAITVA
jgi:hypothetical protein